MKSTLASFIIALALIGGAIIAVRMGRGTDGDSVQNVSVVDGKQIIEIRAKGGYSPRKSVAKADMPTVLRFTTDGTFDCSSAVTIPSIGVSKNLPPSGSTDIELAHPAVGVLEGTCGMGMYPFEIDFRG